MNHKLMSVLAAVCSVCVLIIIGEWFYAVRAQEQTLNSTLSGAIKVSHEDMPGIALIREPEASYADLVTRPLFIKGRRPVNEPRSAEAQAISATNNAFDWQLNGVYTIKKELSALFSRSTLRAAKDNYRKLTVGTDLNGWKLTEIHKDRVLLKQGDQQKELLLRKPKPKDSTMKSNLPNNASPQTNIPKPETVPKPELIPQPETVPQPQPEVMPQPEATPQSEVISPPA